MTEKMSELEQALERLERAKVEVRRTSGPYSDAIKEQNKALNLVYRLRHPEPEHFPLAG